MNLGHVDIYPTVSGKRKAGIYVLQRLGVDASEAGFLCDDENDLELAMAVGHVFIPQVRFRGHECVCVPIVMPITDADCVSVRLISLSLPCLTYRVPNGPTQATAASVQIAATNSQTNPNGPRFHVASVGGALGTEECLQRILDLT